MMKTEEKLKNPFSEIPEQPVIYKPSMDPAFFNIFLDYRHADRLARKDIDDESRLEVIYRILKDQLRRSKESLLEAKK